MLPTLTSLSHLVLAQAPAKAASFWFPEQASTTAAGSDWLFHFIMWISVFFLVLIVGLLGWFMWAYRRRPGVEAERTTTHHTPLELTWTIIPTILVVVIFYFGISSYIDIRTPPENANEVQVVAFQWGWNFIYPEGLEDDSLHVVKDEPTRLVMRSKDVIHSLYVPAFRMKMDIVPGRYSKMWFTPTLEGSHHLVCAEYCGTGHSTGMRSQVVVESRESYQQWIKETQKKKSNMSPVALGEQKYEKAGCKMCHSVDGSRGIGPSFRGIWGREEHLADGKTIKVDEEYIHESILEPQAKIVAGFAPVMPTFKGKLSDDDIHGIIEWMKTLK